MNMKSLLWAAISFCAVPTTEAGPRAPSICQSFASRPFNTTCSGRERYFGQGYTWDQCEQMCAEYASQHGAGCCAGRATSGGLCSYHVGGSEFTYPNKVIERTKSIQCTGGGSGSGNGNGNGKWPGGVPGWERQSNSYLAGKALFAVDAVSGNKTNKTQEFDTLAEARAQCWLQGDCGGITSTANETWELRTWSKFIPTAKGEVSWRKTRVCPSGWTTVVGAAVGKQWLQKIGRATLDECAAICAGWHRCGAFGYSHASFPHCTLFDDWRWNRELENFSPFTFCEK